MKKIWNALTNKILDLSIKSKMQLSFVIISIIPLLVLGVYAYQKTVDIIEVLASRQALSLIREVEYSVTNEFYEIDDLSKLIIDTKSINTILKKSEAEFEEDRQHYSAQVKASLTPFILNSEYIKNIYILPDLYDASFRAMYYDGALYDESMVGGELSYRDDERYMATKNGYNNNIWWVEETYEEEVDFVLTRKIYDASYGFLGVLVIEISGDIMENAERISSDLDKSRFYILDEHNTVIYNKNIQAVGSALEGVELSDQDMKSVKGSYITGANETLVVYNLFLSSDWKLILLIPYAELIKEVDAIRYVVTGMIILMTFLAVFLSIWIASTIYNPLKKIMELMSIASKGDVSVRYDVKHKDDIGVLGSSFNQLMSDMERLLDRVKYEQEEKAKLHVQVLEYQMNPHFLYNTFATMYWMAMEDGNFKLAQLSNSLSNYFKLGLNNGKEMTTVGNEVKHAEDYLIIQKERSSKGFDYEIKVDEAIKEWGTLKIILQPIVENSIMHGFRTSERSDKLIKIDIHTEGGYIHYRVEDNGVGIEDAETKGIEYFEQQGIGVGNTIKRLKLFYDNDFTFSCSSVPGVSTVFVITVPVIQSH